MTIQREDEVRSGLIDHCPVVRVCCAATTFGAIFSDGTVGIVDAHDVELFVLENAEIERRERCVIVPYTDYGDALRPTRDRRVGEQLGHGRGGKAANSEDDR